MNNKILIVDDIPKNIQLLAGILTQESYEIEFATNGEDALGWVDNTMFDLILLDIMMPGMDGFEVCKLIKKNALYQQVPIIFLTARNDVQSITKGFSVGAVDYITKPFEKDELLCRVQTHIDLRNAREKLRKMNEQLESIVELRTQELKLNNRKLEIALAKFKTIFNNSSDAIYLIDKNGKFTEVNDTFCEMVALSREELVKLSMDQIIHIDERITDESSSFIKPLFELKFKSGNGKSYLLECHSTSIEIDNQEFVLVISHDVTLRNRMQKEILSAVLKTEEQERQRFAKDLHDGLGPILSTAKFFIKSLENEINNDERAVLFSKTNETIDEAITNIKLISKNLSPYILKDFGLAAAINEFNNNLQKVSKLKITFTTNIDKIRLSSSIETSLYRIFTELVNNTLKYSGATQTLVNLKLIQKIIHFTFSDNGCGFDLKNELILKKGLGLSNIRTRIESMDGTILFRSSKNTGMSVEIEIPENIE